MSELENKAKPILAPMIKSGEQTMLSITSRTILATWAMKTMMVLEYLTTPEKRHYTAEERRLFGESHIPPDRVWMWMGHYCGHATYSVSALHLTITYSDGTTAPAHLATISLGRLVFQVLSYRFREEAADQWLPVQPGDWSALLCGLWPITQNELHWPPDHGFDDDRLGILASRFTTRTPAMPRWEVHRRS